MEFSGIEGQGIGEWSRYRLLFLRSSFPPVHVVRMQWRCVGVSYCSIRKFKCVTSLETSKLSKKKITRKFTYRYIEFLALGHCMLHCKSLIKRSLSGVSLYINLKLENSRVAIRSNRIVKCVRTHEAFCLEKDVIRKLIYNGQCIGSFVKST